MVNTDSGLFNNSQNRCIDCDLASWTCLFVIRLVLIFKIQTTSNLGNVQNFKTAADSNFSVSIPEFALAILQGVFSYSGWLVLTNKAYKTSFRSYLNFVTEEIQDPYKNLPRAIYISLPAVTIIYMFVNFAYFAVLTTDEILASPAVAFTFAERVLGSVRHVLPLFVAISCIGSINGIIFTSSRMFFAGGRDGQLPELLAMISIRHMTPVPSLLLLCILSVLMLYFAGKYKMIYSYNLNLDVLTLINYLSFSESSVVAMSIMALVKMRIFDPDINRPIKFNLIIPLAFLTLCFYILIAPFVHSPYELLAALTLIISGVPIYLVFVSWKTKPEFLYVRWSKYYFMSYQTNF
jgi:amino acid transporter